MEGGFTTDGVVDLRDSRALDDGPRAEAALLDQSVDHLTTDISVDSKSDITLDQGPSADSSVDSTIDATVDTGVPTTNIGALCTSSSTCTGGGQCEISVGGIAFCTIPNCTPDDPATSQNEDSCPDLAYNICGSLRLSTTTAYHCLRRCQPRSDGNDCALGLACAPDSGDITSKLGVAVCTASACEVDSDCPVFTGGTCNTSTLQGCGAGETCKVYTDGGFCSLSGQCNALSGLCEGHTRGQAGATIGSPCAGDVDCGDDMICFTETTIGSSVLWHQGYCTIASCVFSDTVTAYTCPSGSVCNRSYLFMQGICQKSCDVSGATDCRGEAGDILGDYECYAWDNLVFNGTPVASTPVCDMPVPCDFLSSGCPALGSSGNPTNMACRDLQDKLLTSGVDPNGLCLDNTSSGLVP
ncbi:MAG: hypothetical protein JRH20_04215 [Deltaproteobacteria bacterium]|nr:hypothetical protein [Deltaproteobacteria bacterium]